MNEIIALRDFDAYNVEKVKVGTIQVLISKPIPDTNVDSDWNCKHQILGINDDTIRNTYGVDSLQALLLCIKKVEAMLQYFQKINKVELRWLGLDSLGLDNSFTAIKL